MKFFLATLIMITIALQCRLWIGDGSIAHIVRLNNETVTQESENERIQAQNTLLAAEVAILKNGTDGVEERARQQMGMIKEGETFFLIIDETQSN